LQVAVARGDKRGGKNRGSWVPGLAVLARNEGGVVFVIPAKAGIQRRGKRWRVLVVGQFDTTARGMSF